MCSRLVVSGIICHMIFQQKAVSTIISTLGAKMGHGTYTGAFVEQAQRIGIDVEITTRLSDSPGFQVAPHRWESERTFT
jgi:hypothetical protein